MSKKKSEDSEIQAQETLRFDDEEERERLNVVLRQIRNDAEGVIHKAHFLRALMGLRPMNSLTQQRRNYVSGKGPISVKGAKQST
jgi:hypothetical protein